MLISNEDERHLYEIEKERNNWGLQELDRQTYISCK
ncbi:MAG: hypothetical protein KA807_18135 [Prolixibacteraceae bacterium]|nr:hypothetical protein [Prolixibacteraceae bacterium]